MVNYADKNCASGNDNGDGQMPSLMQIPGMITTTQEQKATEQRRRDKKD
jgi:hypothetical protein